LKQQNEDLATRWGYICHLFNEPSFNMVESKLCEK